MGWDVNVHVKLQNQLMLMMMMMMMMMMLMMTLMKFVNSATNFRYGIDKFYQPNSGLRDSRTEDKAIYTYIIYRYMFVCSFLVCL